MNSDEQKKQIDALTKELAHISGQFDKLFEDYRKETGKGWGWGRITTSSAWSMLAKMGVDRPKSI